MDQRNTRKQNIIKSHALYFPEKVSILKKRISIVNLAVLLIGTRRHNFNRVECISQVFREVYPKVIYCMSEPHYKSTMDSLQGIREYICNCFL